MTHPVVSFIIPVYNNYPFLKDCLDSILKQSVGEIEIICINDCSTDNSHEILEAFAIKDSRIKLISLPKNRGAGNARNIGINQATGKYIRMVDSDDYLPYDSTEKLLSAISTHNSDFVRGKFELCDQNGKIGRLGWGCPSQLIPNASIRSEKLLWRLDQHCAYLYPSALIRSKGLFYDVSMRVGEDSVFILNLLPYFKRVTLLNEPVYYYRHNPASITNRNRDLHYFINVLNVYDKLYKTLPQHGLSEIADYIFYKAFCKYFPLFILPAAVVDICPEDTLSVLSYMQKIVSEHSCLDLCMTTKYKWQKDFSVPLEMRSLMLFLHHNHLSYAYDLIRDWNNRKLVIQNLQIELRQVNVSLVALYNSTSWKISYPLRLVKRSFSQLVSSITSLK